MSNRDSSVEHPGIVTKTEMKSAEVKILQASACASCNSKGLCSVAEMEEKIVEIKSHNIKDLKVGDRVTLSLKRAQGNKAVLYAYFIPFLLVVGTIILAIWLFKDEGVAALSAIGITVLYYFILYLFRDSFGEKFQISIKNKIVDITDSVFDLKQ